MNKEMYLDLIEERFKRDFPKSHLIISYERSIHSSGTSYQWVLFIIYDENPELEPDKVFEVFETFKELDSRLMWHCFRYASIMAAEEEE